MAGERGRARAVVGVADCAAAPVRPAASAALPHPTFARGGAGRFAGADADAARTRRGAGRIGGGGVGARRDLQRLEHVLRGACFLRRQGARREGRGEALGGGRFGGVRAAQGPARRGRRRRGAPCPVARRVVARADLLHDLEGHLVGHDRRVVGVCDRVHEVLEDVLHVDRAQLQHQLEHEGVQGLRCGGAEVGRGRPRGGGAAARPKRRHGRRSELAGGTRRRGACTPQLPPVRAAARDCGAGRDLSRVNP